MRNIYRGKHDLLLRELRALEKDFEIGGDGAGLHLILTDKRGRTEEELEEAARKCGVQIYPMSGQYLPGLPLSQKKEKAPQILLGYAALTEDEIKEGVRRLEYAFHYPGNVPGVKVWTPCVGGK